MPSFVFAPVAIESWLLGLAFYERQRAMFLQLHLDILSAALSAQPSGSTDSSNVVPFRRIVRDKAVVFELR